MKSLLPQAGSARVTKSPTAPAGQTDSPVLLAALASWARREVGGALATSRRSSQVSQPMASAEVSAPPIAPRGLILRLPLTRVFFPGVNQLKETGPNTLATGNPIASRMVIYNLSTDDNVRVTYAVDVYANAASAQAAYLEAVEKSLAAEGFQPLPDPGIGEESFAGTSSSDGGQKHVGVGVRVGNIVIGATNAAYDADPETIRKIVFLTRLQTWKASLLAPVYDFFGLL